MHYPGPAVSIFVRNRVRRALVKYQLFRILWNLFLLIERMVRRGSMLVSYFYEVKLLHEIQCFKKLDVNFYFIQRRLVTKQPKIPLDRKYKYD